jgi:hypothetical protein
MTLFFFFFLLIQYCAGEHRCHNCGNALLLPADSEWQRLHAEDLDDKCICFCLCVVCVWFVCVSMFANLKEIVRAPNGVTHEEQPPVDFFWQEMFPIVEDVIVCCGRERQRESSECWVLIVVVVIRMQSRRRAMQSCRFRVAASQHRSAGPARQYNRRRPVIHPTTMTIHGFDRFSVGLRGVD